MRKMVKQFKSIQCEEAAQEFYGVDVLLTHLRFCKSASGIYSIHLNLCPH